MSFRNDLMDKCYRFGSDHVLSVEVCMRFIFCLVCANVTLLCVFDICGVFEFVECGMCNCLGVVSFEIEWSVYK